jgi:hypothetical protein
MSDESFLERWSRRKREIVREDTIDDAAAAPAHADDHRGQQPPAPAEHADAPAFDISQLPSIDSITASTDIRPFLAPGVPASLRHAALRRVWSADPTIRDFVGLAENAWDFTAPDGVPGFGAIGSAEEVRKLVAQVIGDLPAADEKTAAPSAAEAVQAAQPAQEFASERSAPEASPAAELSSSGGDQPASAPAVRGPQPELLQDNKEHAAAQNKSSEPESMPAGRRRSHGRALPE